MRFVCLFLALALSSLSLCQQMSVADVLKSATRPTKISIKDLPGDYTAVKITSATGFDYMSSYMPMMFLAAGGAQANAGDMVSAVTSSWTAGEVINVEGARFLVTYKMVPNYSTMGIGGSRSGLPSLPDELILELVKVDAISVMSPNPNFTKEKLLAVASPLAGTAMATIPAQEYAASQKSQTLSNFKQVALGTIMYASDCDDELPYVQNTATIQAVTYPYMKNLDVWKTHNPNGGRILFNMALAGVNMVAIDQPAETPLYVDEKAWPDGSRVVAFTDGHVMAVSKASWPKVAKMLTKRWKRKGKPLPLQKPGAIIR